ncbi:ribonuclease H-like domain-containing protein [Tanacetum coccineum]
MVVMNERIVVLKIQIKALVATANNEDIGLDKEFVLNQSTYADAGMTGVDTDDWSIEMIAQYLWLMATNAEVPSPKEILYSISSTYKGWVDKMDSRRPRLSSYLTYAIFTKGLLIDHKDPRKLLNRYWGKEGNYCWIHSRTPTTVKRSAMISLQNKPWKPQGNYLDSVNRGAIQQERSQWDYAIIDIGCSGRKGTIKTSCLDFEKVSYVEELKFNLLSVSQICDKKHNVLFTDKECLILSPKFKFVDEDLVILRAPRKNDVYSLDLKNIIPSGGITCLVAKATEDEAVLWHRRLGHVNFKNINKLVKGNLFLGNARNKQLWLSPLQKPEENNHFRAFDTLWEILHVLDRQDLYHLYRVVDDYYEHIPPTGLGLMLLGDLNIIWETAESSDDDFWKDQEEWEIIRWRFHESSGVHTLEIEDGTMIHMLAERRYPLSRELMIRMLEHGMEVEDESETAITLIHLFILWTTANVKDLNYDDLASGLKEAPENDPFVFDVDRLQKYTGVQHNIAAVFLCKVFVKEEESS